MERDRYASASRRQHQVAVAGADAVGIRSCRSAAAVRSLPCRCLNPGADFAALTERQLRRGVHRSLASLHDAITSFIDQHNADPKPFRWTKSADDILASIERFCHRITPAEPDWRASESGH